MSEIAPRLRLDRSRPHSTIHGERAPGDPHQFAFFCQDGIHYDAHGLHLDHLIADDKTRQLVERRLKRQVKAASREEEPSEDGADAAPDPSEASDASFVNIEAWLRGDAKYQWFAVTKAVRERFHQNITKLKDMVEFLVEDEKIIAEADLDPDFAALLKPAA